MADNEHTLDLTESQRWTIYKLVLPVVVKNLIDEVGKPWADLYIQTWAGYFRITDYIETLMHMVRLMSTNKYAELLSHATTRRWVLMIRLDIPPE